MAICFQELLPSRMKGLSSFIQNPSLLFTDWKKALQTKALNPAREMMYMCLVQSEYTVLHRTKFAAQWVMHDHNRPENRLAHDSSIWACKDHALTMSKHKSNGLSDMEGCVLLRYGVEACPPPCPWKKQNKGKFRMPWRQGLLMRFCMISDIIEIWVAYRRQNDWGFQNALWDQWTWSFKERRRRTDQATSSCWWGNGQQMFDWPVVSAGTTTQG